MLLHLDWLSIYALAKHPITFNSDTSIMYADFVSHVEEMSADEKRLFGFDFIFVPRDYGSKQFSFIVDCFIDNGRKKYEFATISMVPRGSVLKRDAVLFKLNNYILYRFDNHHLRCAIELFMEKIGLVFQNFSRIDIAADFQCFDNGLFPSELIDLFAGGCIRRFCKNWKTPITFVKGWSADNVFEWQYLRVGAHDSISSVYLYNKSLELKKSGKKYIEEYWKANNIDASIGDVWRLEFSLKGEFLSKCAFTLNDGARAYSCTSFSAYFNCDYIVSFFHYIVTKLFDIREVESGDKLSLFSFQKSRLGFMPCELRGRRPLSNRTDRLCLKWFSLLPQRIESIFTADDALSQDIERFVPRLAYILNLGDFVSKNCRYTHNERVCVNTKKVYYD